MNENKYTFSFKLLDIVPVKTKSTISYKVVSYCSFGFLVNLFISTDNFKKLEEQMKKSSFDLTDYVKVYYKTDENRFVYILDL